MLAGQVVQAPPLAVQFTESTTLSGITSLTPINGSPLCGGLFVAPQSGNVLIGMYSDGTTSAAELVVGWRVRTGITVGSGTVVDGTQPGDGANAAVGRVVHHAARHGVSGGLCLVTGLTAGTTYNVATHHWVTSAATASVFYRRVTVVPLL